MSAVRMEAIEQKEGCVHVRIRVQPRASRNAVRAAADGSIRVALTAPPVDGEANTALVAFLAKLLGVPKTAVSVIRGEKSREKVVSLSGVDAAAVRTLFRQD